MANRAEHELWGGITGAIVAILDKDTSRFAANPFAGAIVGHFASRIPDLLEPATSPNHREFFHSWVAFSILGCGIYKTYKWKPECEWKKLLKLLLLVGGCAYASHLVLDSRTNRSLPVI